MFTSTRTVQKFHMKHLGHINDTLKSASIFTRANLVLLFQQDLLPPLLSLRRGAAGLSQPGLFISYRLQPNLRYKQQSHWYSDGVQKKAEQLNTISNDACPQGIQGDNCVTFKLWLENCRRYGLANCDSQLQGIQSGRKTLAEVLAEQDKLVADIANEYKAASHRRSDRQGVQDAAATSLINADSPCPQGVQGYDCARFKLWLENCHRFGLKDCTHQFENFKAGRKSLAEIFHEQDQLIREVATTAFQKASKQRRSYSTSTKHSGTADNEKPEAAKESDQVQLTQGQKLKRAVKEYGSTVIVFHVTISLMSLGFFYLLVSSGIDVVGILTKLGIGSTLFENKLAAGAGTFVVAYAVHKVFAPVRIATTLTSTPFIVRYLRSIGFLKVPQHSKSK